MHSVNRFLHFRVFDRKPNVFTMRNCTVFQWTKPDIAIYTFIHSVYACFSAKYAFIQYFLYIKSPSFCASLPISVVFW